MLGGHVTANVLHHVAKGLQPAGLLNGALGRQAVIAQLGDPSVVAFIHGEMQVMAFGVLDRIAQTLTQSRQQQYFDGLLLREGAGAGQFDLYRFRSVQHLFPLV